MRWPHDKQISAVRGHVTPVTDEERTLRPRPARCGLIAEKLRFVIPMDPASLRQLPYPPRLATCILSEGPQASRNSFVCFTNSSGYWKCEP
jgi:hypothetical protein